MKVESTGHPIANHVDVRKTEVNVGKVASPRVMVDKTEVYGQ